MPSGCCVYYILWLKWHILKCTTNYMIVDNIWKKNCVKIWPQDNQFSSKMRYGSYLIDRYRNIKSIWCVHYRSKEGDYTYLWNAGTCLPNYTVSCQEARSKIIPAIRALDFKIGLHLQDDTKSVPEWSHVSLPLRNQFVSQILLTSCM
jgi:hypothetical protein